MRKRYSLASAFSLLRGFGRDPLGWEIISPITDGSDWVQVRDGNGYVSYLPRTHLEKNGHPIMAGITYVLSVAYILPFIQFWL